MVACATAAAVMAFSAPASAATTLNFYANGPADSGRGCDMTTKAGVPTPTTRMAASKVATRHSQVASTHGSVISARMVTVRRCT